MSDTDLTGQSAATSEMELPAAAQATVGPGAQLAAHRQARGFTIEQVANQLNLAPRQIQALEEDNYAALPGIVIARGFIRAYAKLLKVDPVPLVSLMQGEVPPMESLQLKRALSGSYSESRLPPTVRSGLVVKWAIVAASLVFISIGVLAAYWLGLIPGFSDSLSVNAEKATVSSHASEKVATTDQASAMTGNAVSASSINSNETPSSNQVTKDEIAAPNTSAAQAAASTPAPIVSNPLTTPKQDERVAESAAQSISSPTGKNMLVMKLLEDSWIEIRGADNTVLISRLMNAGSTETLSITKPVSVTVGNATGVEMTLRGKPVDLKSAAKNNVAHIDLK